MRNAFADELTTARRCRPPRRHVVRRHRQPAVRQVPRRASRPLLQLRRRRAEHDGRGRRNGDVGLRPIAYTITPFVTTRCLEQIRTDVCYHEAPVIIAGVGAGLSYAGLGPTHHACEDIAFLRSLPNMVVVCPGDAFEVRAALRAALRQDHRSISAWAKRASPWSTRRFRRIFRSARPSRSARAAMSACCRRGPCCPRRFDAAHALAESGHLDAGRVASIP